MKRKLLLLLSCVLLFSITACTSSDSGDKDEERSTQLQETYDFYADSIETLEKEMKLDTKKANDVFEILIDIGLDEEISYCFEENDFYKVWWGLNKVNVYLTNGSVQKITDEDKLLYSSEKQENEVAVSDILTCPQFTAEPKTSAMVDQIASVAKTHASSMTDEQAAQIISIIREADHKFYNDQAEMEKFMWYGCLLDYKYDDSDPRSQLGTDLYQAVKYVYREVESVSDNSTQENLMQIDKNLEAIK